MTTEDFTTSTASRVTSTDADSVIMAYTTADALLSSLTAGDAVIDDILSIQTGLNELPEDLLAFILALEQRLEDLEKLLSGYTKGTGSPVGPVGPVLSPKAPDLTSETTSEASDEATASEPTTTTSTLR